MLKFIFGGTCDDGNLPATDSAGKFQSGAISPISLVSTRNSLSN